MAAAPITPGLLILHGNRAEMLGDALFSWIRDNPLGPLEEDIFLVQSNGVAEWLKMALAAQAGVCAATRVELPARFLWRSYRQVLGSAAVPPQSALDKLPLTWRLMHLLPEVAPRPGFEALAGFLRGGDMARRLQLAQRLADLYDQYQVYRGDWLAAWEAGHDVLPKLPALAGTGRNTPAAAFAQAPPLPPDQLWQAALWRDVLAPLSAADRAAARARLHETFLAALASGAAPASPVARRVILFGMTHVPMQTLQALAALSAHSQVLLAVPNPSRYHWADIIEGRELLRMERRRQPLRGGRDLARVPLEDMHAHGHPLLAAWGRQSRDFVRQLDAFDDAVAAQQRFSAAKIDLFDDTPAQSLLQQVQAHIRDLVPLGEHPRAEAAAADRSIVFHVAHSAQREVEILHDQLLALLAAPPGDAPLQPRDIVVMVPDIAAFAPAIRSVFGQYPRGDARFIPFDIADLGERGNNPLLVALEWLLRLPQQRCGLSEVRDLLDVPAVAARFGLQPADLPRLAQWMEGAGVRWGLNVPHRAELGLAACGEQNTWLFGLRRMLLGYASGDAADSGGAGRGAFLGIEPYGEVSGLEATLAGSLADLLGALTAWWTQAGDDATPAVWAERARDLMDTFFAPSDERERITIAAAQDALRTWIDACALAEFDAPVSLAVLREAWLDGIDAPGLNRRFRAGGVTFCTLLPMRAVPFEAVCLLGMTDGDYPRGSPRSDFDLMGLPGQRRPGDRSRRDDDRQLMLEALLSARRVLYVSWTGRSVRDNSAQPPSVLVSQLRDYLAAGWSEGVLEGRTTEHPLQPFSRRYFEAGREALAAGAALFTHAREWRAAHAATAPALPGSAAARPANVDVDVDADIDTRLPLTLADLTAFLKNPVKEFFQRQLDVAFRSPGATAQDDETFALDGLSEYGLLAEVLDALGDVYGGSHGDGHAAGPGPGNSTLAAQVAQQAARIRRSGRLPMAALGQRTEDALVQTLVPMLERWATLHRDYPVAGPKEPLQAQHDGVALDDWLDGLHLPDADSGAPVWLELLPSRLCSGAKSQPVPHHLVKAWVRTLAASACGVPAQGVIVGRDATITVAPLAASAAASALRDLLAAWREGMRSPLPVACKTAIARLSEGGKPEQVYDGGIAMEGEAAEPSLARMFPDFPALTADGSFDELARRLYGPMLQWIEGCVTVQPHAGAAALAAADGDGA